MEATEIETKPILETSAMDHGGEALEEATATQEAEPKVQTKENKKIRQKVGRADQIYIKSKRKFKYFRSSQSKSPKQRFTRYVVLVRTIFSDKGVPKDVEIDIKGSLLRDALLAINVASQETVFIRESETISRKALYHSKDGLSKLIEDEKAKNEPNEDLLFELTAGLEFIAEEFGSEMNSLAEVSARGTITFRLLWMLYAPNTFTVGHDELGQTFAFIVRTTAYREHNGSHYFQMTANHLDHNGKNIVLRTGMVLNLPGFDGETNLAALPVLPMKLHPDPASTKQQLLTAFTKAEKFHGRHLAQYKGHALRESKKDLVRFNNHGRVMLDPVSLVRTQPENMLRSGRLTAIKESDLTDELRMTMSPKLYGFSLGDKTWGAFALSRLTEVDFDPGILQSLMLKQERKDIIRDLVAAHQSTTNTFDDFVRDKGKGLVGLLAGPPGVGKTMTAEAIAEITERPLYVISSGELGTESGSIHSKLKEILELAELWHAVVLLDEADLFLSKRNETDLQRNAITSIFLRELEYYQGILILTTNRLKAFDPAFHSRIHFCIEYGKLEADAREPIWKDYLARAAGSAGVVVDIDDDGCTHLSRLELNGRQIKNVMSVTQSIATTRKEAITVSSIEKSIELCSFANEDFE